MSPLSTSSTTAAPFSDVREELAGALTRPVRWRETVIAMHEAGAPSFVEVGPGNVLSGLVRRIDRSVNTFSVNDLASLEKLESELAAAT